MNIGHNSQILLDLWQEFDACHEASKGAANDADRIEGQVAIMRRRTAEEAIKAGGVLVRIKTEVGHGRFAKECDEHGVSRDLRERYVLLGKWLEKPDNPVFATIGDAVRVAENERDRAKAEVLRAKAEAKRAADDADAAKVAAEKADKLAKKVRKHDVAVEIVTADPTLTKQEVEQAVKKQILQEKRDATVPVALSADSPVYVSACADLHQHVAQGSVDAIVTDPPYLREFVSVYGDLARFAVHALKPGGLLLAMGGQLFMPETLDQLRVDGLRWRWMISYQLPQGQSHIHAAKVATRWKPVYVFTREGGSPTDYSADVIGAGQFKVEDTEIHKWGQSVAGFRTLIGEWVREPGSIICDPFCGAGAPLVAAKSLGHRVCGSDIEDRWVQETRRRLS